MSLTSAIIAFAVVVVILVVYINRTPWNADTMWERQAAQLRAQGSVAERPEDWERQVQKQRTQFIYIMLGFVVSIAGWFAWSIYH